VLKSISAKTLKNSTIQGDFPKEAVFQHLFMDGLTSNTPISCDICPELSKIFPQSTDESPTERIPGEIDFFLNGSLRWGIELLVNGSGISEHIDRFNETFGKYAQLKVSDYCVVDLRGNESGTPTNVSRHEKRLTVFFKTGDYSVANCIFGLDQSFTVYLAP